jgi:hypothetical protein
MTRLLKIRQWCADNKAGNRFGAVRRFERIRHRTAEKQGRADLVNAISYRQVAELSY